MPGESQAQDKATTVPKTAHNTASTTSTAAEKPILRVGSDTDTKKLAGAIANFGREGRSIRVRSIGNGAHGQFLKAVATARGWLESERLLPIVVTSWLQVQIEGNERTALENAVYFLRTNS